MRRAAHRATAPHAAWKIVTRAWVFGARQKMCSIANDVVDAHTLWLITRHELHNG